MRYVHLLAALAVTFVLYASTSHSLQAQPTLSADNFPIQDDFFPQLTADGTGISAGASGEDITWDFRSISAVLPTSSGLYVHPDSTGLGELFPEATICQAFNNLGNYYELTDDAANWVGAATNTGINYLFSDPLTEMQYPFTYSSFFTDTAKRSYDIAAGTIESEITVEINGDAYGTLRLPTGDYENVLRVHTIQTFNDSLPADPTGVFFDGYYEIYDWYTQDSRYPIFTIEIGDLNQSGTVSQVTNVIYPNTPQVIDEYGYTQQNSTVDETECNWVDITGTGVLVDGLSDDNFVGPVDMGFDFQYYWTTESEVWIGSNGYVAFDAIQISSTDIGFPTLPTPNEQNNFVAPLLCDLSLQGVNNTGEVYYWTNEVDSFIVTYDEVPFWDNNDFGYVGSNTFQVIFSAVDSSITFNYLEIEEEPTEIYQARANPVVVGIENISGEIGMQHSNYLPPSNSCIQYHQPDVPLIEVLDAFAAWNLNEENGGVFMFKQSILDLQANVANVGSVAIAEDVSLGVEVITQTGESIDFGASTQIVAGLDLAADQTVVFESFPALETGSYTMRTTVGTPDDANPANDVNESEIVVVDSLDNGQVLMSYAVGGDGLPVTSSVSWQGGGDYEDGIGVYMEPPFYPVEILAADYYIAGTAAAGFQGQVLAADSLTSTPSTLLAEGQVKLEDILNAAWNRIEFEDTARIESGGFYLTWLMEESGVALGVDAIPPFSRRNFEILNDAWSPYRSNDAGDAYIRVVLQKAAPLPVDTGGTDTVGVGIVSPLVQKGELQLSNAQPNPTNGTTVVPYQLPTNGNVTFYLTNALGQVVGKQQFTNQLAGDHFLHIPLADLPVGIYTCTMHFNNSYLSTRISRLE